MRLPPCSAIFYCPTETPPVSVTTPAHTVLNILLPWFAPKSHTLHAFSASTASYEEWLNWELFDAFLQHGYHCEGRPSYQQLGDHPLKSLKGDLLATHPETQEKYLIEVALVGAGTQDKWREKIQRDHQKLQQLQWCDASQKLHRIQLVFLASSKEQDLVQAWDYWLQKIPFYPAQSAHCSHAIALNRPGMATQGEAALLVWNVAAETEKTTALA